MTKMISFYEEVAGLVDEGKAVDIVYLDAIRRLTLCPIRSS